MAHRHIELKLTATEGERIDRAVKNSGAASAQAFIRGELSHVTRTRGPNFMEKTKHYLLIDTAMELEKAADSMSANAQELDVKSRTLRDRAAQIRAEARDLINAPAGGGA